MVRFKNLLPIDTYDSTFTMSETQPVGAASELAQKKNETTPSTMAALLLTAHYAPYKLVHDHPTPRIQSPNQILVKVAVAAFCHSDDMIRCPPKMNPSNMHIASLMPFVASHEGVGYVCEIGDAVRDFKVCF